MTGEPPSVSAATLAALNQVSTATVWAVLRRLGVDHAFLTGLRPSRPDLRMTGVARTLRYVALREDVFADRGSGMNEQKPVVDTIEPGEVLVIEARGEHGAGTIGDILALPEPGRPPGPPSGPVFRMTSTESG